MVDQEDLRRFLASEFARVVGAVTLVRGNRALAEDAVEEAVARAWLRSTRGEALDSLSAWVTKVALNEARGGLRRLGAERRARDRLGALGQGGDDASLDRVDVRTDVRHALGSLPRRQRETAVLHYFLGYNVAGIADTLGVREGTVKTCLHRARHALAASLLDHDRPGREADGIRR